MAGKIIAGVLVLSGLIAGIAVYYLQIYAFYHEAKFYDGAEIVLTPIESGAPEPILVENLKGIDSDSSPLRFRACFTTPLTLATLSETYIAYDDAVPLVAPPWFDCFDAAMIGAALEKGEALAFLSTSDIHKGVDRVVAVFPDGRGYAWHQLNASATE